MKTEVQQVQLISIKDIIPEKNQPRQYFAADKMRFLKDSIAKFGIKNALRVETLFGNRYQLLDGERRFRSAQELGLEEVPAIVEPLKTELDRLVLQFQLQEHQVPWNTTEKAVAIGRIAHLTKVTIKELCKDLGISPKMANTYLAFFQLHNKELFEKNEIPLDFAPVIAGLNKTTSKVFSSRQKNFTKADQNSLEKVIILKIKSGIISTTRDITKIKDAVVKSPESVYEFMDSKTMTTEDLFSKTKAKGAWYLRNTRNVARALVGHINGLTSSGDVKLDYETIHQLKTAKDSIKALLNLAGE